MTYVKRLQLSVSLPQNPPLEPPRRSFAGLVGNELLARYCKDVVKLLQSSLLGLRDKEENHDERADVQPSIEPESTSRSESSENGRERDGEDRGPEETGCDSPAHAYFSVGQREDFSRIGEWHWPLTRGVECGEQVNEECNQTEVSGVVSWDEEAEASCEQSPGHVWEREE